MVYIFLPFLSAALYGLSYVLLDKILKEVPIVAFMLISSCILVITIGSFSLYKPDLFSISFMSDKKIALIFFATIAINITAWITTLIALQNTSASYVAFAEISYPLFTILFLFLFFGENQFTWQSLLGGFLILVGSIVLVASQLTAPKAL